MAKEFQMNFTRELQRHALVLIVWKYVEMYNASKINIAKKCL